MATAAVFVDAGYVFGGGSRAAFGKPRSRRALAVVDVPGLIRRFADRAADCCGHDIRVLRSYWYDGAVDGVPAPEQVAIADLPRVKLRLGRVSSGGQKGVDGLIILDLINLARDRAIDVAILVSGDEDLVLIARLAELTGQFPVERSLLERARATCVRLARGGTGDTVAAS